MLGRWNQTRSDYTCVDHVSIIAPNKVYKQNGQYRTRGDSAENWYRPINAIAYKINKKTPHSRVQLFISKSEFDREMFQIVRLAKEVRTIAFPNTIR